MNIQNMNLPVSFEAEQSVIGSVLINPDCISEVVSIIDPEDFYVDAHRSIYIAMKELFSKSQSIDYVTVIDMLVSRGIMDTERAKQEIARILNAVPTAANVKDYAKIVKDKSLRRSLINICGEIQESAASETDSADRLLELTQKKMYDLTDKNNTGDFQRIDKVVLNTYRHLQDLAANPEAYAGISTGFSGIDNFLNGMGKGDMVVVGARPGVGKTSFTVNIGTRAAKELGKTVCIFSLEMSAEQLVLRMLSSEAKIDSKLLRSGRLTDEHWKSLASAATSLSGCDILIDDTPGISVTTMKSRLRKIKNLGLVIIDYLQLMEGEGSASDSRANQVGAISRGIKLMAKEFGVPIITCAQLNRAVETNKENRDPQPSDLRDSGSIEQDADSIMFLQKIASDELKIKVIVAKNRHGATGFTELGWTPQYTTFYTIDTQYADAE